MLKASKYTKRKVFFCNTNIHFNHRCVKKVFVPKCAKTEIRDTSQATNLYKGNLKCIKKTNQDVYISKTKVLIKNCVKYTCMLQQNEVNGT